MLKRLAFLVLIAVVAAGMAPHSSLKAQAQATVNCGTDQNVTLNFIAGQVGSEHDVVVALAKMYMEACPNITVNVAERPTSTTDTIAQYQQFFQAQSADMDVFQVDVGWTGQVAEHFVDFNETVSKDFLSEFYPSVLTAYTIQGRLVAMPWFGGAGMLYYRTDLLQKYGLDVPKTWDDLYAAAKKIQDGERASNPDFWGFVFQGAAYEGLTCDALEWQASSDGGIILKDDGTIDVNNPGAIAIFDKIAKWVGDVVPPAALNFQEEDARAVWQAGNAAFMRNWGYAYGLGQTPDANGNDPVIKDKFAVTQLPGMEAGKGTATLGGWGLGVSKYSKNVPAAVAFVQWLTSTPQLIYYTVQRGEQPVAPAVYDDAEVQAKQPFLVKFKDVTNFTARPSLVAGDKYSQVSEDYYTAVHDVLAGNKDAATAMSDLELQLADLGFTLPSK